MAGQKVETTFKVIYFDGVCNLCDSFVSFLFKLGLPPNMRVASLQGNYAHEHLDSKERENLSSVIYQTGQGLHRESGAVIRILSDIKPYLYPLRIFLLIPAILRDPLYQFIAKNRYRFFGKRDTCRLPSEKEREYFL